MTFLFWGEAQDWLTFLPDWTKDLYHSCYLYWGAMTVSSHAAQRFDDFHTHGRSHRQLCPAHYLLQLVHMGVHFSACRIDVLRSDVHMVRRYHLSDSRNCVHYSCSHLLGHLVESDFCWSRRLFLLPPTANACSLQRWHTVQSLCPHYVHCSPTRCHHSQAESSASQLECLADFCWLSLKPLVQFSCSRYNLSPQQRVVWPLRMSQPTTATLLH